MFSSRRQSCLKGHQRSIPKRQQADPDRRVLGRWAPLHLLADALRRCHRHGDGVAAPAQAAQEGDSGRVIGPGAVARYTVLRECPSSPTPRSTRRRAGFTGGAILGRSRSHGSAPEQTPSTPFRAIEQQTAPRPPLDGRSPHLASEPPDRPDIALDVPKDPEMPPIPNPRVRRTQQPTAILEYG